MTTHKSLPFDVGQLAEAKSYLEGFRGAWFRCKITKIIRRGAQILLALEYYDFPDEKIELTNIYKKRPKRCSNSKEAKRELKVRPHFPPVYRESELPDINTISEVIVVIDGEWRVGDLVDWWSKDVFWSGTITEILDDDRVKIKFPEPPLGEGSCDVGSCKDLRPSLDWSPEFGWTVPVSLECQNGNSRVRVIQPVKQASQDEQNVKATPRSSLEFDESTTSSRTSACSMPLLNQSKDSLNQQNEVISKNGNHRITPLNTELDPGCSGNGKPSCSDSVSGTYVRDVSTEVPGRIVVEEQCHESGSFKKLRVDETIPLNSTACDSIGSTIMDFEELLQRVRWLKRILKSGISSDSITPAWKFVEHP